jgi:transcription initiation factor TFIIIB Brf1 subunit/transcription initiation factor TFIIB
LKIHVAEILLVSTLASGSKKTRQHSKNTAESLTLYDEGGFHEAGNRQPAWNGLLLPDKQAGMCRYRTWQAEDEQNMAQAKPCDDVGESLSTISSSSRVCRSSRLRNIFIYFSAAGHCVSFQ